MSCSDSCRTPQEGRTCRRKSKKALRFARIAYRILRDVADLGALRATVSVKLTQNIDKRKLPCCRAPRIMVVRARAPRGGWSGVGGEVVTPHSADSKSTTTSRQLAGNETCPREAEASAVAVGLMGAELVCVRDASSDASASSPLRFKRAQCQNVGPCACRHGKPAGQDCVSSNCTQGIGGARAKKQHTS